MTLSDLKTFFRKRIKVLPGGPPVGTPGTNRSQGVLEALDALAEEVKAIPAGGAPGFSLALLPNGDYQPSPELLAYLDAGGELYWMSPNAAGQRQLVNAGTSPNKTPAANSAALNAMAAGLLQP